ncbi:Crp/Fnr family transcriptional regulator [Salegentibacter sp. BDJ18]|uniref:Crp/Fnr family transcriptional regulator n=1 Tax=Salegentibacter sp. BDJ18 TaxID=2816376 RepID=UPI001AAF9B61|nr:Crp/Fnr family transcriptional regulator [Salegentibacter sp. BDJ18]MBO2544847.1 Crp/Fnr family transcriptional regulator [Salegentibacter sp. BDJ18]
MKRILYILDKTSGHLIPDELAENLDWKFIYSNSPTSLESLLIKNKPDFLIWAVKIPIPPKVIHRNSGILELPILSIIAETGTQKPLHKKHHFLSENSSEQELKKKILFLTNAKMENFIASKKPDKSFVPNIEALKSYMEKKGELISLDKHKILFHENRHSSFIYLIKQGLVKTSRMDQLGKELITGIYRKNDLLGLYGFHKHPVATEMATTLEASGFHRILYTDFREILQQNQELSLDLAQYLTDTVLELKSQLLEMAYASVLKKTSNTILQFAEEMQNPEFKGLNISRTDLASIAGISTESFIRSLSSLKKEGIIAIKGKKINILKPDKLQEIT